MVGCAVSLHVNGQDYAREQIGRFIVHEAELGRLYLGFGWCCGVVCVYGVDRFGGE